MTYRVSGLSPEPFRHLFGLDATGLSKQGARRLVATEAGGMPDRIALRDALPGEAVLLVNYIHQPADTPFRSSHAIYLLEGETAPATFRDELPPALRTRLLSIRAFDANHMMIDADVAEGREAGALIERMLSDPAVAYLHAHYARMGCYAALIERS